mmetsp:Transcript_15758/g.36842  ORF Transcript_15758/g.36842 Transcript_15758/m.36842 type:complete len:83 (-) Transcript_15758:53-301(-)
MSVPLVLVAPPPAVPACLPAMQEAPLPAFVMASALALEASGALAAPAVAACLPGWVQLANTELELVPATQWVQQQQWGPHPP